MKGPSPVPVIDTTWPESLPGDTFDVVIVGFGPSGQVLATELGRSGHRVAVFDRSPEPYPLPRAGHADDEIVRIFQSIGVADSFVDRAVPAADYEWLDAAGELLFRIDWNRPTRSGWRSDYIFYQPFVEEALIAAARRQASVEVHLGWEAVALQEDEDGVNLLLREGHREGGSWEPTGLTRRVRARYVIGADGARSFVRRDAGMTWVDYGFQESLSILDLQLSDPDMDIDMPDAGQICDPARPVSLFRWLGREHARWEFMLMPGEDPAHLVSEDNSWQLLQRWNLTPDNATMIRRTLYTFQSLLADSFGRRRVYLVGDAAHLMPPFLGQGMCSGIRDVVNLAWKLDLVLRGICDVELLASYTAERRPHVEAITKIAIELGRVVCETDPVAAKARDDAFRAGHVPPPEPLPGLAAGVLHRGADGRLSAGAGTLSVQGQLTFGHSTGRGDDVVAGPWRVLCRKAHARKHLSPASQAVLDHIGATVVHVTRTITHTAESAVDRDGIYSRWFADLGVDAVVVRPDFYVFGSAAQLIDLDAVIQSLGRQLTVGQASTG